MAILTSPGVSVSIVDISHWAPSIVCKVIDSFMIDGDEWIKQQDWELWYPNVDGNDYWKYNIHEELLTLIVQMMLKIR